MSIFGMDPWAFWLIIGIISVIIEIFDPAFFFLALGVGAIVTSLLCIAPFIRNSLFWQLLIFAVLSFITFLLMRKLGKKVLADSGKETNVYALKGKTGVVTQTIPPQARGRVKIGGEEWSAISEDDSEIEAESRIVVLGIDGNKLIVKKEQE
ncbi:MAG: NfeD family protein [Candidatus Cloacimonadaceae bacterium]|jgi:membrane protein implicated in regulation of membrane protease activity